MAVISIGKSDLSRRLIGVGSQTAKPPARGGEQVAIIADWPTCAQPKSHLGMLRKGQRVLDVNAQISHCRLDFGVAEQELDGPEIAALLVDN